MFQEPMAARLGAQTAAAQTTTGGVRTPRKRSASSAFPRGPRKDVVVADTTTVSAPPPPCRIAAWITARIHQDLQDTPWCPCPPPSATRPRRVARGESPGRRRAGTLPSRGGALG